MAQTKLSPNNVVGYDFARTKSLNVMGTLGIRPAISVWHMRGVARCCDSALRIK